MTSVLEAIDAESVRRWVVVTRAALAARRAEIDALNVYPVPDGDTGTNMYLTLDQALDTARTEHERLGLLGRAPLDMEVAAMARAALMSARGNSGVILSQLIRGVSDVIAGESLTEVDARAAARAVEQGARRARESVVRPQEGTILSVADATAAECCRVVGAGGSLGEMTRAAVVAARSALAGTTEQLDVLADAGVVDAGGAGYLLFVEALDQVVHEEGPSSQFAVDEFILNQSLERRADWSRERVMGGRGQTPHHEGPAYEVMYLLHDVPEEELVTLRGALDALGDSVVVSSAEDVSHVHVHTDDIGGALEAGLAHGAPQRPSSPAPPARASPGFSRRPGRGVCPPAPGTAPPPASSSRRSGQRGRRTSFSCRTTATPAWLPTPQPAQPVRRGRWSTSSVRGQRCRASRRLRSSTPLCR